jgi:hypothetical protein
MKRLSYALLAMIFFFNTGHTQQTRIADLTDEFDNAATLNNWKFFHEAEKFPNKIKMVNIDGSRKSNLYLEPLPCGWYADFQGAFMFKEWQGDFDVITRLKVSGKETELPRLDWSLAGLMVRVPKTTTQTSWQAGKENWLFLTAGVMEPADKPVFETKTTVNSQSDLRMHPARLGWVEIRIVHIGNDFVLLNRYENENWNVLRIFNRPDMQGNLQIGLNAYTGWNVMPREYMQDVKKHNENILPDTKADLVLQADYIRFQTPKINSETLRSKGIVTLSDKTLSFEKIAAMLED